MKKYIFLSAALLLFTVSCSNNENNNEQKEPAQAIQFSFTNEDFGEDEAVTRANAAGAKPQIVDLGDCEAEISVESEPAAKTRGAQTPANGHYTIRAYQGGTLKGEMSGTFSGSNFTPDGGSQKSFRLPHGTYDFIAFNDDVTVSGNDLTVTRDKVQTARMGTSSVNITGSADVYVPFTMKHVGCRLRTQFVCQKHIPENITATLEQTAASVIPTSVAYNPATKAYTTTNGTMTAEASNSPASTEAKYSASTYGQTYAYTSTSNYHYFLPTTAGNKLKLNFSAGTVFWKPLTGTIPQLNAALQMQSNKSYLVKIKLKPNFTYLFTDGTTGHFKETTFGGGTKTPIGVVVNKDLHLAMALDNASPTGTYWSSVGGYVNANSSVFSTLEDQLNDMDGYKWTWEPSGSADGVTVKANDPRYYAFYNAGHYSPTLPTGVNLTNGMENKKWYLPSMGQWKYIFTELGFGDGATITDVSVYNPPQPLWYGWVAEVAFTQVNGPHFMPPYFLSRFWLSTEYNSAIATSSLLRGSTVLFDWFDSIKNISYYWHVRPFITY